MKQIIIYLLFVISCLTLLIIPPVPDCLCAWLNPVPWSTSPLTIVPYVSVCSPPAITVASHQPWGLWGPTQHPVLVCCYSLWLVLLVSMHGTQSQPYSLCLHQVLGSRGRERPAGTQLVGQGSTLNKHLMGGIPCFYFDFTFFTFSITNISSLDRFSIASADTAWFPSWSWV